MAPLPRLSSVHRTWIREGSPEWLLRVGGGRKAREGRTPLLAADSGASQAGGEGRVEIETYAVLPILAIFRRLVQGVSLMPGDEGAGNYYILTVGKVSFIFYPMSFLHNFEVES